MIRLRTQIVGWPGSPYLMTNYFEGSLQADADAGATALTAALIELRTQWHTDVDYAVETNADVVSETTGQVTASFQIASITGSGGFGGVSTGAPTASQGLLQLRTGVYVAGREIRGRIFIPCVLAASNDDGRPTSGYRDVLLDAGAALIVGNAVVWSRSNGSAPLVSSVSAWTEWAVLRSRRD